MMKNAYAFIILCFLAIPVMANAKISSEILDEFDPLEERFRIEAAFIPNYREMMRDVVVALGQYAQANDPSFQVLLDGGQALLTRSEWENNLEDLHKAEQAGATNPDEAYLVKLFTPENPIEVGTPNRRYIGSIGGLVLRNQVCGKKSDKISQSTQNIIQEYGLNVIAIEHCNSEKSKNNAVIKMAKSKIPVHTDTNSTDVFDNLPDSSSLYIENPNNIDSLDKVRNMLVLTNTRAFADKDIYVKALTNTNYDLLVIEPFFKSKIPLTKADVTEIQAKKIGARRLVFATLNIGVAEDTRLYWEHGWKLRNPIWLRFPSKTNPAGYVVDYWNSKWKDIIGSYFKSIMDLGFDGVVLQGIDEHKTYERIIPID